MRESEAEVDGAERGVHCSISSSLGKLLAIIAARVASIWLSAVGVFLPAGLAGGAKGNTET